MKCKAGAVMKEITYAPILEKIQFVIKNYKENFKKIDEEERYKWEAIGWYKKYWDINADDFAAMLANAFGKTHNLLSSGMYFAHKVLIEFAQDYPEEARALFKNLHNETLHLEERYHTFRARFEERLKELQKINPKVKKHDQDLRAIMLYLTFEYPEKYYLFKATMFDDFSKRIGFIQQKPERNSAVWKADSFMDLCDIILEEVKKDKELITMSKARLDESCYQDEALHLLTMDIVYYGSQCSAWLLTWNPSNWEWKDFDEWCDGTQNGEKYVMRWTCQSKKPKVGDHVFLMKSGEQPRGVMAHGYVVKPAYEALHYDSEKAAEGIMNNGIDVEFDWIQNVNNNEAMLQQDYLKEQYPEQSWSPMASGIAIDDNILLGLAKDWKNLINEKIKYWPSLEEYNPNLTKEDWKSFLTEIEMPNHSSTMQMLKALMELGGEATCKKLASTYGGNPTRYVGCSVSLGKRAKKFFKLAPCMDDEQERYFSIPFLGRYVVEDGVKNYSYKIRLELHEALKEIDLSDCYLYVISEEENMKAGLNTILYGPPGTGKTYNTAIYAVAICDKLEIATVKGWQYEKVMERYKELLAEERVAFTTFHQSYGYEDFIEGIKPVMISDEDASGDVQYSVKSGIFKRFCERAKRPLTMKKEDYGVCDNPTIWKVSLQGTGDNPVRKECLENGHIRIGIYSEGDLRTSRVENSFINKMKIGDIVLSCYTESTIDAIGVITGDFEHRNEYTEYPLLRKVNWIVKGIQEDILSINGGAKMTLAAVHGLPRVSLEDVYQIIEKYSPISEMGITQKKENYVFIIDEINRGNISKIFGELITLIEDSKRAGRKEEASAILPYSGKKFSVPQNVYIIGTMNTADRSIALMDTALRRRFSFVEMMPDTGCLENIVVEGINIAKVLDVINKRITYLYDREHTIGHAFFMKLHEEPTMEKLAEIFEKSIIPLLQEYFYEDYQKIQLVLGDNAKSDMAYKFIQENETKVKEIFKGAVNLDLDLPEYNYIINKNSFSKPQSYIEIYS